MARPIDTQRKHELRDAAADYLLAHGITDFALRPLARALGTSARMLVHHFGSRESLLRDAVETIRDRERAALAASLRQQAIDKPSIDTTLRWHWRRLAVPRRRAQLRQMFELYALALREPHQFQWAIDAPLAYWIDTLKAGNADSGRAGEARATLILATLRGLLLDFAAGGDTRRVEQAFGMFLDALPQVVERRSPARRRRGK
jgi:AcrR family transcriptional regulator